jgi:hypothetical protein
MGKCKTMAAHWVSVTRRTFGAFLGTNKDDTTVKKAGRVGSVVARRAVFMQMDYALTAAGAAIAVTLHTWHPYEGWAQILFVFSALWVFELLCAMPFIFAWRKTGIDVTLAADARRAMNQLSSDSKIAGKIGFSFFICKGLVWDGPEEVIIFFYNELQQKGLIMVTLIIVSAIQAALWGFVFIWGYEMILWLISLL